MKLLMAAFIACLLPLAANAAELTGVSAMRNRPQTPFKISDDIYYVGARDITSFLIDTGDGFILTDGGFIQTAPLIEANVKALGFDIQNVKILLNSHAHFDHAGGLVALKAASGAQFYASAGDAPVLASGGMTDFAFGSKKVLFPPVKPDVIFQDGGKIALGHTELTVHVTPGHTKGCTSWTMVTHVDGKPINVLFICSLSVLPSYRLVSNPSYPGIAADYRHSIATLRSLPCDIFLGSHGTFFDLQGKVPKLKAGQANPFIDPAGCKAYLRGAAASVDAEIAKERRRR